MNDSKEKMSGRSLGLQLSEAVNAEAIVSVSDPKGFIVYANENFCEITGYSMAELIGKPHRIINSGFHSKAYFAEMWNTIQSGKVWKGEVKNKRKDGTFYWVLSTIVPIRDQEGNICSYVSVRHDVTAQKETQSQLLQASKLSALGEITAKVAHELNNPLAVVLGMTQLLMKREEFTGKSLEFADKILKAAERMGRLISQMKKHSRNSAEDPREVLSFSQIVENALILTESSVSENGINLVTDLKNCKAALFGDAVQLESLVQNLITNSIDAFNKPHVGEVIKQRNIKIMANDEGTQIKFVYEDDAGGIPESVQKHMFDTFFTTKEVGKGTGLGLSMIKTIIKEHQGELLFESTLGQGTRFMINFPQCAVESEKAAG